MLDKKGAGMIKSRIRQVWMWSKPRRAIVANACGRCMKCLRRTKKFQVDHVAPVVPVTGWDGWNSYIERMFDYGTQIALCKKCHKAKTNAENKERRKHKKIIGL